MTLYQFPVWTAGERLTAATLTSAFPQYVVKSANQSLSTNTGQFTDLELQFNVNAGSVYIIEFWVQAEGLAAGGITTTWGVPVGTSGYRNGIGQGPAASDSTFNGYNVTSTISCKLYTNTLEYGMARNVATGPQVLTENSVLTAGSTGVVALNWGQTTSNTTATTVTAGSWGRCTQIA